MRLLLGWVLTIALGAGFAAAGSAQPYVKASEKAMVSQTVDGTVVTVEYSRPSARGREIFGALVPWNQVWTPGANWATTFDFSRDVTVAGEKVAAGKYSVWALPGEKEWTILLHEDPDRFHLKKPKPAECRYSLSVKPHEASHVESLAFYFTDMGPTGATLNLHWGDTAVALPIGVERSFEVPDISEADATAYLGRYEFKIFGARPEPIEMKLTLVFVEGQLRGYLNGQESLRLVPTGTKHSSLLADLRAGRIVNVQDFPWEFEIGGAGRATGYEFRNDPGGVRIAGERLD